MEGLSHRQYYVQCESGMLGWGGEEALDPQDYQGVPYPHPYLLMWLECKRYPLPNGAPALPEPEKGPLEQDADIMLAFEVLEEAHMQLQQEEEARQHARATASQMEFSLPLPPTTMMEE